MLRKAFYVVFFAITMIIVSNYFFSPKVFITLLSSSPKTEFEIFYKNPKMTLYDQDQAVTGTADMLPPSPYPVASFNLPFSTPTDQIRVDFGNAPEVYFNLREITILKFGGFCKIVLTPDLFPSRISLASQLKETPHGSDCLCFKTVGSDPYAIINLAELPAQSVMSWGGTALLLLLFFAGALLIFNHLLVNVEEHISQAVLRLIDLLRKVWKPIGRIPPYYYLCAVFIIFVLIGITGSSIGLIRNGCISEVEGEYKLAGKYRGIRSDEFIAHGTASAIQNYNHQPRFPLINKNIGIGGRNFLFLHDWGAPVKHPAMIVRPANWGFFIFGLRSALSWYWCFPIFFGIFAFTFLLDTLFGRNSWFHMALAVGLVFSPYSVCWSFWPVNCGAGALLAVAAVLRLFQVKKTVHMFLYALLAGWSFSVSAATLYFPHIWPCVTLGLVILVLQLVWMRKEVYSTGKLWSRGLAVLFFLLVAAGLLTLFFTSIQDAISAAMNSASGQRIRLGGLFQSWDLIRGWMFPLTLYKDIYTNQCEMQSYQLIVLPLIVLFVMNFKKVKNQTIIYALLGFISFALVYQYLGIPSWLAHITVWDHCTEPRVSFAIQIAQFLLLGGLVNNKSSIQEFKSDSSHWKRLANSLIMGLLFLCLNLLLLLLLPQSFRDALDEITYYKLFLYFFIAVLIFFFTVVLLFYQLKIGALFFALICFLGGALFNPICIAPTKISSHVVTAVSRIPDLRYEGRVLLVGNSIASAHPQYYVMAGGKTLNGFFCYEDIDVFNLLLKDLPDSYRFHRLNHMTAEISDSMPGNFTATIPQGDCIRLKFNGAKYNFSKLPIDFIVNLVYNSNNGLEKNPSIKYYSTVGVWQLWRVVPVKQTKQP